MWKVNNFEKNPLEQNGGNGGYYNCNELQYTVLTPSKQICEVVLKEERLRFGTIRTL